MPLITGDERARGQEGGAWLAGTANCGPPVHQEDRGLVPSFPLGTNVKCIEMQLGISLFSLIESAHGAFAACAASGSSDNLKAARASARSMRWLLLEGHPWQTVEPRSDHPYRTKRSAPVRVA